MKDAAVIAQFDEAMAKIIADFGLEEANEKRAAFHQVVRDELAKISAQEAKRQRGLIAERLHPMLQHTYLDVPALDQSGIVVMPQPEQGEEPAPLPPAQEPEAVVEPPLAPECYQCDCDGHGKLLPDGTYIISFDACMQCQFCSLESEYNGEDAVGRGVNLCVLLVQTGEDPLP